MTDRNSSIGIFPSHIQAQEAIEELQRNNFDIGKLSIVGRDHHTDEHVVGYYNTGDHMKYWGERGAFWGGILGLLLGSAFFFIPGIGPLVVAGPLVNLIVGALEGAVIVGGLSVLGVGLYKIGIPMGRVLRYESAIKSDKYVLIYHGSLREVDKARQILDRAKATETHLYFEEFSSLA